ncbi:N-acyl homoserine lactonase family protein [Microbacterium sp. X-17]|uniref:N-acyl homoserine lactonase family protein n=1 Tax=Microbacterium sp. X-17 TaxID=3144404 RepID=UPI0031F55430
MTTTQPGYEVYALRYYTRQAQRDHEFHREAMYAEQFDDDLYMDYSFWLVRNEERIVLVDCGFDKARAAAKGRHQLQDPVELLAVLGVAPEDVDEVIVTHMHYDHVGNIELFPNAQVTMARAEYEYWTGPYGARELMQIIVDPIETAIVTRLKEAGRLTLVEDEAEVAPGIRVERVGGHTPGQLIVEIQGTAGTIILASDAAHYYDEIDLDRPYNLFVDLGELYGGYDRLRELDRRDGTTVVAGHDPRVAGMFRETSDNVFDLNDQLRER